MTRASSLIALDAIDILTAVQQQRRDCYKDFAACFQKFGQDKDANSYENTAQKITANMQSYSTSMRNAIAQLQGYPSTRALSDIFEKIQCAEQTKLSIFIQLGLAQVHDLCFHNKQQGVDNTVLDGDATCPAGDATKHEDHHGDDEKHFEAQLQDIETVLLSLESKCNDWIESNEHRVDINHEYQEPQREEDMAANL